MPTIEIGSAVYSLTIDLSKLTGNLSAAKTQIDTFVKNAQTGLDSIHFNAEKLGQQAQAAGQQVGQKYVAGIQQVISRTPVAQQPTQVTSQAQRQIADSSIWQAASRNAGGLLNVINGLSGAVYKFGDGFVHAGQIAATSAYRLGLVLAPIGIGLALATKEAMAFETQMKLVKTQIDGMTAGGLTQISDQVLKLSSAIGTNATESAKALYYLVSSTTLPQEQIMGIMEAVTKSAVGGAATAEQVMIPLTIALNTYGKEWVRVGKGVEFTEHALDVMFQAVKRGRATYADMITQEGRMIELGKLVGASFEEINATWAAMTRVSPPAQAATYLENLYKSFSDPKTLDALNKWGIAFEKVMTSGQIVRATPLEILDQIAQKQKELGKDSPQFTRMIADLWGNIRERLGGIEFLGGLDEIKTFLKEMQTLVGQSNQAYEEMADNVQFKFQKAWNNVINLGIKGFLSGLKEPLSAVADLVTALVGKFDSLSNATKGTVAMWLGLAVASPMIMLAFSSLLMVVGALVSAMGALISPMGLIGAALTSWAAGGILSGFIDTINAAGGGIKGLITLLMALAVQFGVLDQGQAVQFMSKFGISTKDAARYLAEAQTGTGTFGTKVKDLTSSISDLLSKLRTVLDVLIQVGKFFADNTITIGIVAAITLLMANLDKLIAKFVATRVAMTEMSSAGALAGLVGAGVIIGDIAAKFGMGVGLGDATLQSKYKTALPGATSQLQGKSIVDLQKERDVALSRGLEVQGYRDRALRPWEWNRIPEEFQTSLHTPDVGKMNDELARTGALANTALMLIRELEKHPDSAVVDDYSKAYDDIIRKADAESKLADERSQKERAFLQLQQKGIPIVDPMGQTVEERQKSQEAFLNADEEVIQKREDYNEKLADLTDQESEIEGNHTDRLNELADQRAQSAKDHLDDEEENQRRWQEAEREHTKRLVELEDQRKEILEGKINALTGMRQTAVSKLRQEYRDAIQKIVQDFNRERSKAEDDFNRSQTDKQTNFNQDQGDRQTNLARELEDLERNHQERLQEIKDKAAGVELSPEQQEQRDYEKRKTQLQQDFDLQNQRATEDFNKEQARAKAEFAQQQKEKALQFREQLKQEKSQAAERIAQQQLQDAERLAEIDKNVVAENERYIKQVDDLTRATDKMEEQYNRRVAALSKSVDDEDKQYAKALKNWQKNRDQIDQEMTDFLAKKEKEISGSLKLLFGGDSGTGGYPDQILQQIGWKAVDSRGTLSQTTPGWGTFDQPDIPQVDQKDEGFFGWLGDVATNTDDWFTKTFGPIWEGGWDGAKNTVSNWITDSTTAIQTGLDSIAGHSIVNNWLDYLLQLWNTKFSELELSTNSHLTTIKDTYWGGHLTNVSSLLSNWWNKLTTLDLPGWVGTFLAPNNFPMQLLKISGFWDSMLSGMGNSITNFFKDLPKNLSELLSEGGQLFESFKKVGSLIVDAISKGAGEVGGSILDAILKAVTGRSSTGTQTSMPTADVRRGPGTQFIQGGYGISQGPGGSFSHRNLDAYDYTAAEGTNIYSPFSGEIIEIERGIQEVGNSPGDYAAEGGAYGNHIKLRTKYGTVILGHMEPGSVANFAVGQQVNVGDYVGQVGSTGYSSGPHLHAELQSDQYNLTDVLKSLGLDPSSGGNTLPAMGGIGGVFVAIGTAIGGAILRAVGGSGLGSPELYAGSIKERNRRIAGVRSSSFAPGQAGPEGAPEYVLHPASQEDWEARFWWLEQWKAGTLPADEPGAVSGIRLSQGAQVKGSTQNMIRQILDRYDMGFLKKIGVRLGFHEFHKGNPIDALNRLTPGQLSSLAEALNYYEQQDDKAYKTNLQHYISTMGGAWGTKDVQDAMAASGVTDLEKASTSQLENVVETVQMNREAEKDIPEGAPEFVKNPRTKADYVRRFYWLRRYWKAKQAVDAGQDVEPLAAANKGRGLEPAWEATSDTTTGGTGGGGILSGAGLADAFAALTTSLNNLLTSIDLLRPDVSAIRLALAGNGTPGENGSKKDETPTTTHITFDPILISMLSPIPAGVDQEKLGKSIGDQLNEGLHAFLTAL